MTPDPRAYHRAQTAALLGLITQAALTLGTLALGASTREKSITQSAWFLAAGLPIWVNLFILFRQHRLERIEALNRAEPTTDTASASSLFAGVEDDLYLARQRLAQLYKWSFHATSLIVGLFLVTVGLIGLWRASTATQTDALPSLQPDTSSSLLPTLVLAALTFVCFTVARYQAGMASVAPWQLLRAGAAYLMGNLLILLLLLAGAVLVQVDLPSFMPYVGPVADGLMILLGAEFLLNLVLGLYRPRRPGQAPQPAFDSRLLGWLAQPRSIAKLISETIAYQFGVDLSSNWAYQFALRAVAPLTALALVTLWALSSLVIVAPDEQALITRFGRVIPVDPAAGHPAFGPGLHVKLPWPLGRAYRYPVNRVRQIVVGSSPALAHEHKALLWTNQHAATQEEYLVTAPTLPAALPGFSSQDPGSPAHGIAPGAVGAADATATQRAPDQTASGVSLVSAQASIQYRVRDLQHHLQATRHPEALLAALAERQLNAVFLTQDIDTLIGPGRLGIADLLKQRIQHAADALDLGVEILFVGLMDVHPPPDQGVAAAFLEQIDAQQQQRSDVEQADQAAIESLSAVAGSYDQAQAIDQAINALTQFSDPTAPPDRSSRQPGAASAPLQEARIERLMISSQGLAAQILHNAYADRWQKSLLERAKADRFSAELAAYRNAPRYYRGRLYLDALSQSLTAPRKIVMRIRPDTPPLFRIDLKDAGSAVEQILQDAHE